MSTRALQFDILLLGFRDPDTDAPLAYGVVNFLSAGTSDPLTVWDTKEKTGAKTSVTLDVNGQVQVYGDGVYKLEVLAVDTSAVSYSPIDNVKIRAVSTNVVETNTTYTATTDDDLILCDTSGGAVLINLYPAADFIAGLTIKNISVAGNNVTIDPDGAELIDGAATQDLVDGQANEFFSNGTGWFGNGVSTGTNFTSTSLVFSDGLSESTGAGVTTLTTDTASTVEAQALVNTTKSITPSTLGDVTAGLICKVVELGDWNMDATINVSVTHGIADFTKIRQVTAMVRNDAATSQSPIDNFNAGVGPSNGGVNAVSSTAVSLFRLTSGVFDGTDYDSTSYNRGWITIWYVA